MSLGSEAEKLGYRWEIDPPRIRRRSAPEEYDNMSRWMNMFLNLVELKISIKKMTI
jgi:hypothetical protein